MNPNWTYSDDDKINPIYCTQCRIHIPRNLSAYANGLCPDCVQKLQAAQQAQPQALQNTVQQYQLPTSCPQCRAGDIYKVSEVYKQGNATGSSTGGVFVPGQAGQAGHFAPVVMQSRQQTMLAQQLVPPNDSKDWQNVSFGILTLGLGVFLFFNIKKDRIAEDPGLLFTLGTGICILLGVVLLWSGFSGIAKARPKCYPVWSRLWYCARCGCVFDPTTNRFSANGNPNELY